MNTRTRIEQADYPEGPDWCCQRPVYSIDRWGRAWNLATEVLTRHNRVDETHHQLDGCDYARKDGLPYFIQDVLRHFVSNTSARNGRDALDITDRWLRIFHGGSLEYRSTDDATWFSYRTAVGDEAAGIGTEQGENPVFDDLSCWVNWAEGEVFWVITEESVDVSGSDFDTITEWEEVERSTCYGYESAAYEAEMNGHEVAS